MEIKKNPEADINKKRGSLMFLGLTTALAVTLTAFEYTALEKKQLAQTEVDNSKLDDEVIIDIPQPETPPPPPPPVPVVTEINVVEDDKKINENQVAIVEQTNEPIKIVEVKAPVVEVEEIYDVVEESAEFPGGMQKMYEFIGKNLVYPAMARESNVQGKVFVNFVVSKDGSISDVKVLRGIGSGCDEEAMRVVKMMPKWQPAKNMGKPVKARFTLPINFKLQ
jgi:protein TonB